MQCLPARSSKDLVEYVLNDYQFLEDYEVVDAEKANKYSFVACIKNTDQKVRFIKRKYSEQCMPRFKALHKLYKNGIILADNMFILQECDEYYFYVIEAEIEPESSRFETLHRYLYNRDVSDEERKSVLGKLKILVDCLHQESQAFAGLDPRKIVIDSEGHLYLAPFDLDFELKTDNYSRAYFSPEILSKIEKAESQISEQMMQKWDIWSFGCISLQLLAYSSPVFMATSLSRQLKQIKHLQIDSACLSYEESIRNVLLNSLMLSMDHRTISTSAMSHRSSQREDHQNGFKDVISRIGQVKSSQLVKGVSMREMNIHQKAQGDCLLILNILTLSNVSFEKQLHVSVHMNKVFHFYVDYDEKQPKKYILNRRITMKGSLDTFEKWMSQPLLVKLKQNEKQGLLKINLHSLVMLQDGKRIWNEPLIGTYSAKESGSFRNARLKVSCTFTTQQSALKQLHNQQVPPTLHESVKSKAENPSRMVQTADKLQGKQNAEVVQAQKKPRKVKETVLKILQKTSKDVKEKIPSISEISQNISLITQELKRKMFECQDSDQDDIQKQLSSLLDIETA